MEKYTNIPRKVRWEDRVTNTGTGGSDVKTARLEETWVRGETSFMREVAPSGGHPTVKVSPPVGYPGVPRVKVSPPVGYPGAPTVKVSPPSGHPDPKVKVSPSGGHPSVEVSPPGGHTALPAVKVSPSGGHPEVKVSPSGGPSGTPSAFRGSYDFEAMLSVIKSAKEPYARDLARHLWTMNLEKSGMVPVHELNKHDPEQLTRENLEFVTKQLLEATIINFSQTLMSILIKMPYVGKIAPADFQTLLQTRLFDVWQLWYSPLFINDDVHLRLACGARASRWWIEQISPSAILQQNIDYSGQISEFRFTDVERVIFGVMQLTSTDDVALEDAGAVEEFHDLYEELFIYSLQKTHPGQTGRIIGEIHEVIVPLVSKLRKSRQEFVINKAKVLPADMDFSSLTDFNLGMLNKL